MSSGALVGLLVAAAFAVLLVRTRLVDADDRYGTARIAAAGIGGVAAGLVLRAAVPDLPLDVAPTVLGVLTALAAAAAPCARPTQTLLRRAVLQAPTVRSLGRRFGGSAAVALVVAAGAASLGGLAALTQPGLDGSVQQAASGWSASSTWRMTVQDTGATYAETWVPGSSRVSTLTLVSTPDPVRPVTLQSADAAVRAAVPGGLAVLGLALGAVLALRRSAGRPSDPDRSTAGEPVRAIVTAGAWLSAGVIAVTVGYDELARGDLDVLRPVGWALATLGAAAVLHGLLVLGRRLESPRRPAPPAALRLEMSA